jgi:phage tail tape-measure protein
MWELRMVKNMVLSGLLLVLLVTGPVSVQAQSGAAPESVSTPDATSGGSSYKKAGLGCAAGAVLGSVVPGVGNIVGCVVGGLFGWWR